jgi:L-ribulokinase
MALKAAGAFSTIEEAQGAICLRHTVWEPEPDAVATYELLYKTYRRLYFAFGAESAATVEVGDVLPALRTIAAAVRRTPHRKASSSC